MTRSRMSQNISLSVLVLAVMLCFVSVVPTQATAINPPAPGTQFPDLFADCTGCTLLASSTQTELDSHQNWQATLETVVLMDPLNAFGGGLDFFYEIKNLSPCSGCTSGPGPDDIARFTAVNFSPNSIPGGLLVDIGVNVGIILGLDLPGSGQPGTVDRVPPGDTIGWTFSGGPFAFPLTPGSTSIILEIQTNATNFAPGFAEATDDGGGVADFNAFQPAPAQTPEPASMLLLGTGLLGLAPLVRRRFVR